MNPICKQIRQDILEVAYHSGHGHIPSCFSVVEILWALYGIMRHDPAQPRMADRDLFILSKGHAALAHYCTLAKLGYFPSEAVRTFGHYQSTFGCHADRSKVPGVEVSTGSLGHGIGVAVGAALGLRLKGSSRQVFVIVGDGESNEGTVWEALLVAESLKLANLTVIYDNNLSHSRGLQIQAPLDKLKAFGCDAMEVPGHDLEALRAALLRSSDTVKAVVANTVKGYGCPTLIRGQYEWHRRSPDAAQLAMLMEELDAQAV